MVLDYPTRDAVQITMYDYIKNMLVELPPVMDGESRTRATLHLFELNEESVKLSEKDARFFNKLHGKITFSMQESKT